MNPLAVSCAEANRELVNSFVRYLESRGMSPQTIRAYGSTCARFAQHLGASGMMDASTADIRAFLGGLLERGVCENSVRLHTEALRAFYRFVRNARLRTDDPTARLSHRKIPRRIPRVPTVAEIERLINAARNPFERAIVELFYATGIRVAELAALRIADIQWPSASEPGIVLVKKGKGRKDRLVPFGGAAAEALRAYLGSRRGEFVFESPRAPGRSYSTKHIRSIVRSMTRAAGLGRIYPHLIRHSFTSHMAGSGAGIREIQVLLGHKLIATTGLYAHLTADNVKESHRRFHPHGEDSNGQG